MANESTLKIPAIDCQKCVETIKRTLQRLPSVEVTEADTETKFVRITFDEGSASETQIRDLFGRHKSASEIDRALSLLSNLGKAKPITLETGGRPRTTWRLCSQGDQSDQRGV